MKWQWRPEKLGPSRIKGANFEVDRFRYGWGDGRHRTLRFRGPWLLSLYHFSPLLNCAIGAIRGDTFIGTRLCRFRTENCYVLRGSPKYERTPGSEPSKINVTRLLVETLIIIAVVEMLIMVLLPRLLPGVSDEISGLLDTCTLTVIVAPLILWRTLRALRDTKLNSRQVTVHQGKLLPLSVALVIFLGISLTVTAARESKQANERASLARFNHFTEQLRHEIELRARKFNYGLLGLEGVFVTHEKPQRQDIQKYLSIRNLPTEFPGAQGFGLIQRVPRSKINNFIKVARQDGSPKFSVRGTGTGADLFVLRYMYPTFLRGPGLGLRPRLPKRNFASNAIWSAHDIGSRQYFNR